jgi:hypothetical protein
VSLVSRVDQIIVKTDSLAVTGTGHVLNDLEFEVVSSGIYAVAYDWQLTTTGTPVTNATVSAPAGSSGYVGGRLLGDPISIGNERLVGVGGVIQAGVDGAVTLSFDRQPGFSGTFIVEPLSAVRVHRVV